MADTTYTAGDGADIRTSDRWSWLADTYWYVPAATLPAMRLTNLREVRAELIQDQTLWHIERYDAGYVVGSCVVYLDGRRSSDMVIVGSVTPPGDVLFAFSDRQPVDIDPRSGASVAAMTTGGGRMVRRDGGWAFLMQMTGGSSALSISHWSWMLQSTPGDPSWSDIPGLPGTTIGDVFS